MKSVRIGIAGLGRLGRLHAANLAFKVPGAQLTSACSVVPAELEFATKELGVTHTFSDFSEMCNSGEIDAAAIVTPSTQHPEQVEIALKAGLHIFCEKPLAVTMDECYRVEEVVNQYPDQIFMLGFMRRYDPSYAYAKEKIDRGEIGEPYLVKAIGVDPDALAEGLLASGFVPASGGIMLDMASHDIDLMRWFLGAEVKEIYALGSTFKYPEFRKQGDEETACALLSFQNGAIGQLHVGRTSAPGYHIETEIVGTEGSIRISPVPEKNLAVLYEKNGVIKECVPNFQERFEQAYINEMIEFCECVLKGKKPGVDVHDGTMASVVSFAAKEALESGKPVQVK